MSESFRVRVMRSLAWQGGGQFAGQAISWLSTLVVIRLLTANDYGLLGMANVLIGLLLLFADLGFGAAVVQARTLSRDEIRDLQGAVLLINVAAFLLTLALAPALAAYYGEPRLIPVVQVLAVNFLLLGTYVMPQAELMREMDFRTKAGVDLIATVVSAATSIALASAGYGVWALVGGTVGLHLARALGYNLVRPPSSWPRFAIGRIRGLARFGALITLDRLLFFLFGQADVLIGGRVLATEVLGLYVVALSLAVIPMEKLVPILTQVALTAFARIQDESERVRRNVARAVGVVGLVCFPAFVGMAAVAGDLVPLVLGERWTGLILPFQLLCLSLPLRATAALLPPALFGVGRAATNVANMALSLILMTAAFLVGVRYGIHGLSVAWVTMYPVVFLVTTARAAGALGMTTAEVLRPALAPAAASAAMGAVVWLGGVLLGDALGPAVRLALLIVIGIAAYAGLVALVLRDRLREITAVVRR